MIFYIDYVKWSSFFRRTFIVVSLYANDCILFYVLLKLFPVEIIWKQASIGSYQYIMNC